MDYNLYYTEDFLQTNHTLLTQCSGFRSTPHYLFMARYDTINGSDLYATDYETLEPVKLQLNLTPVKHNFRVLDAQPDRVLNFFNFIITDLRGRDTSR